MVDPKPRLRQKAPKERTGCITCKRRRVKCDERKPFCARCEVSKVTCDGYNVPKAWIFESKKHEVVTTRVILNADTDVATTKAVCQTQSTSSNESWDDGQEDEISQMERYQQAALLSLYTLIPSDQNEEPVLMHAYIQFVAECPVAWDTELYGGKYKHVQDQPVSTFDPQSPIAHVSQLALATTTLHMFFPHRYPAQLYLKHIQRAIGAIRRRIRDERYLVDDLLHGISQLLLATVLSGDETAARAHLGAAEKLVDRRGGLYAIDPSTAQTLRYADMHLAVETIKPPKFLLPTDVTRTSTKRIQLDITDSQLQSLRHSLHATISHDLPLPLQQAANNLSTCVNELAHIYSTTPPPMEGLNWIATQCLRSLHKLLRFDATTTTHRDTQVTLIVWIQVFTILLSDAVIEVDIAGKTLLMTSKDALSQVSLRVSGAIAEWNNVVSYARKHSIKNELKQADDWLQLIEIVREMEAEQTIKMWPLMQRLLNLRFAYMSTGAKVRRPAAMVGIDVH